MSVDKRQVPRAAQQFNKAAATIAGHRFMPLWALIEHRGRKSGKAYTTPIAIAGSTHDSVYIALPWGRSTDWVRNLQAADGGTLRWKGRVFTLSEPRFVGKDEALAATPAIRRRLTGRWLPDDYLRLRLRPHD